MRLGETLLERGHVSQDELDRALEINPTNSAWHFNRGLTLDALLQEESVTLAARRLGLPVLPVRVGGRDVILGDESHIYHYENGGASALGGLVFRPVRTLADGTLPLDALRAAIHLQAHNYHYYHYTRPGVMCLENTHNRCYGAALTPDCINFINKHYAG